MASVIVRKNENSEIRRNKWKKHTMKQWHRSYIVVLEKKTEIINSLCNSFLSENQKLNKGNNRIKHEFTKLTASIKCNKIKLVEVSVIATENE